MREGGLTQDDALGLGRSSLCSEKYVSSAAPTAASMPHVSALSPHGSGRRTALWQVVGPPSSDMHTAGQSAMRTMTAASHGTSVRMLASYSGEPDRVVVVTALQHCAEDLRDPAASGRGGRWTVPVVTPQDDLMSSRIAVVAIDAVRPEVVADFWCKVLGWRVVTADGDLVSIGPEDASWPTIDIVAVPERKVVKNRLHLDLRADGTTTQQELERLLALGARHTDVGQDPDSSWVVLSDPEGNEFCLLSRSVQEVSGDPAA